MSDPTKFEKYRTEEERYWDNVYDAHLDGDCIEDCPLCREEDEYNSASDLGLGLGPRTKMRRARDQR